LAAGAALPASPIDLFVSACLKGEVRLPADSVRRNWKAALDADIQAYGLPKMNTELKVVTYRNPKATGVEKLCNVHARRVNVKAAADAVRGHVGVLGIGPPSSKNMVDFSVYFPAQRYQVDIYPVGNHVEMQTTILEPEFAARANAKMKSMTARNLNQ
jgi:hypothetical protein